MVPTPSRHKHTRNDTGDKSVGIFVWPRLNVAARDSVPQVQGLFNKQLGESLISAPAGPPNGVLLPQLWCAVLSGFLGLYFSHWTVTNPPTLIYMGRDKVENEELIKYGFPEDLWWVPHSRAPPSPLRLKQD